MGDGIMGKGRDGFKPVANGPSLTFGERRTPGEQYLDESLEAVQDFMSTGKAQAVAMTLYAAATHVADVFPAFGRMFFTGDTPNCGKTTAMMITAYLSANPLNTKGSDYAFTSGLAEYHNSPERGRPTLYRDEISDVFGKSGLNSGRGVLADVLREGYKRNAVAAWSVNRVREEYSIYSPFLMAGNGTALPTDIRTRSLVIKCVKGKPRKDLDSDGSEPRLRMISAALGAEVKRHKDDMRGFNCEGAVNKLTGRTHQIWRPLIAVAHYVGGERWLRMAFDAFAEITSGGAAVEILSADQQTMKDLVDLVTLWNFERTRFVGGSSLAEELALLPRFEGRTVLSVAQEIARVMPVDPIRKRIGDAVNQTRGYYVGWIMDAWEAIRPKTQAESVEWTEVDPFADDDDTDNETPSQPSQPSQPTQRKPVKRAQPTKRVAAKRTASVSKLE